MNRDEKSFEDLLNRADVKEWLFEAERDLFPKMEGSVLSMVINGKPDAKLALEVGAAILFGKPMIVLAQTGATIPAGLRKVAHAVVEIDDFNSPESRQRVQAVLAEFIRSIVR